MNDEQRAALVEELAEAIDDARTPLTRAYAASDPEVKGIVMAIMPIIDRLLADRATTVAEPDADFVEMIARGMYYEHRRATRWEDLSHHKQKVYRKNAKIAAMPSCADADADWLDKALDSVSARCRIDDISLDIRTDNWIADIIAPAREGQGLSDIFTGTGPTRKAAILDAVQKAKETHDEV